MIAEIGHISFYYRAHSDQLYAIACHRCERPAPAVSTFHVAEHGPQWRAAALGFIEEHLHRFKTINGIPGEPLPFPDREA